MTRLAQPVTVGVAETNKAQMERAADDTAMAEWMEAVVERGAVVGARWGS